MGGLTEGTSSVVRSPVCGRLEGYGLPISMGKHLQAALLSFLLCRCLGRDDATTAHPAAPWATAVGSQSTTKSQAAAPIVGSAGWWDMGLLCPQGSVPPAHSRHQVLERNHAVTEPGGEFQLDKSPPRSADHLFAGSGAKVLRQGERQSPLPAVG